MSEAGMFTRFDRTVISWERLRDALRRRVLDVPHALAWGAPWGPARSNRSALSRFEAIHKGERCFILANGPSLGSIDLGRLVSETTFGMNRIYLAFDRMGFQTTYYLSLNELVLEQFSAEIRMLTCPKFLNWNRRSLFEAPGTGTAFLRQSLGLGDGFRPDPRRPISSGGTVTYAALQLAYYMGFDVVVLLGLDHSYTVRGAPNTTRVRSAGLDHNHFHPAYFPPGTRWQLPDLRRSEIAYEIARRVYERVGRRILDATEGGRCSVFERANYGDLF
jgi:hypothetical protein